MVAPTFPVFNLGVNLGDLPQDVKDIKDAVGTPAAGMTLADAIGTPAAGNEIEGVVGTPAAGTTLADAIGTPAAGTSIAGVIGTPAAGTTLAGEIEKLATKEDIAKLAKKMEELFEDLTENLPKAVRPGQKPRAG